LFGFVEVERAWHLLTGREKLGLRPHSITLSVRASSDCGTMIRQGFRSISRSTGDVSRENLARAGDRSARRSRCLLEESFPVGFDELARDRFILGTTDEAIEQIEERIRRLESNYLIFR